MRLRRLALLSAIVLAGPACGKSAPDAPPPPPADTAPAVDTTPPAPASPLEEHAAALSAPLAGPEALDAMLRASDALTVWAKDHADAPDAGAAALAGARGHLLHGVGGPLDQLLPRTTRAQRELDALATAGTKTDAIDPAPLAKAAAAVTGLFAENPFVLPADALAIAAGAGDAAEAVRAAWTAAATTAIAELRAAPEAGAADRFTGGRGRLVCADCGDTGELAPAAVVPFLLDGTHGAGLACEAARKGGAEATDAAARAKLLRACPELGVTGDAELAVAFGQNPLHAALLARAAGLAAMPDGDGPLAPVIAARKAALAELLAAPYPLPVPALTEPLPEGDRPAEASLPAPIDGLAAGGLAVTAPAMSVFVVAPDGVRAGVRPTVGVKDGALVSLSKAVAGPPDVALPDLDGGPVLTTQELADAELDEETQAVAQLVTAATLVSQAATQVVPDGEGPHVAELVVDALAPAQAVVRTLDSLKAAGIAAVRFTRTAGDGALPLVVRAAPDPLPAAASPGFARPIIISVMTDAVDVWGPDEAADPAPTGDADAALPETAETGYRGKTLVRLRVTAGDADARGLTAETVAKVLDAVAYWRKASGAGPLVHVAAADDARAADVLRLADAFQGVDGEALAGADALWPGATCPTPAAGDAPARCPSGVAVAFSAIAVPSSRGITPKPAEKPPKEVKPVEPPPSPEFCNTRDIQSNMAREKHAFRFCYESQLRVDPKLEGKVTVTFTIDLDGSVKNVRVGAATLKNERVTSCLVKAIGKVRFGKPDGGRCLVRWPFVFQAK